MVRHSPEGQTICTGCAAVLQAATQAEVDNVITFNDAGEGVSITKLSPAAVKANTVSTKCPANDKFTGACTDHLAAPSPCLAAAAAAAAAAVPVQSMLCIMSACCVADGSLS
jgi:hypothetical protein